MRSCQASGGTAPLQQLLTPTWIIRNLMWSVNAGSEKSHFVKSGIVSVGMQILKAGFCLEPRSLGLAYLIVESSMSRDVAALVTFMSFSTCSGVLCCVDCWTVGTFGNGFFMWAVGMFDLGFLCLFSSLCVCMCVRVCARTRAHAHVSECICVYLLMHVCGLCYFKCCSRIVWIYRFRRRADGHKCARHRHLFCCCCCCLYMSTDCGGMLTAPQGTVRSPGHPNVYPHGVNCTWLISVPEGLIIQLSFSLFRLEGGSSCYYDYVQIYDGNLAENATQLGENRSVLIILLFQIRMVMTWQERSYAGRLKCHWRDDIADQQGTT